MQHHDHPVQLSIPGVDVTPVGASGLDRLDAEGAHALVHAVDAGTSAMHWITGDVAIELMLRSRIGDHSLDDVDMPANQALTTRCVRVGLRFPMSRRRPTLSWSHHELVASMSEHNQDRLLDAAEDGALSVRGFRLLIQQEAEDMAPRLDNMPVARWKPAPRLAVRVGALLAAHPEAKGEIDAAVDGVLRGWGA